MKWAKGDTCYFVDVTKEGSVHSRHLPQRIMEGRVVGIGNTYISVRMFSGFACFSISTLISQKSEFKLVESEEMAKEIMAHRKAALARIYGEGGEIIHIKRER